MSAHEDVVQRLLADPRVTETKMMGGEWLPVAEEAKEFVGPAAT